LIASLSAAWKCHIVTFPVFAVITIGNCDEQLQPVVYVSVLSTAKAIF